MVAMTSILTRAAALLSAVTVMATAEDPALGANMVPTALVFDDQCDAGDDACALNALQRRGARLAPDQEEEDISLLAEESEEEEAVTADVQSGRRRSKKKKSKGPKEVKDDIAEEAETKLSEEIAVIRKRIDTNVSAVLVHLENVSNETHRLLMSIPLEAPMLEAEPDQTLDAKADYTAERRHHTRRRRGGQPPRQKHVQTLINDCQKTLDSMWLRMNRCDRLYEWSRNKLAHPGSTPNFQEKKGKDDDDDDMDDEYMLGASSAEKPPPNPQVKVMEDSIKKLDEEIKKMYKQMDRMQKNADKMRKNYCHDFPKTCPPPVKKAKKAKVKAPAAPAAAGPGPNETDPNASSAF